MSLLKLFEGLHGDDELVKAAFYPFRRFEDAHKLSLFTTAPQSLTDSIKSTIQLFLRISTRLVGTYPMNLEVRVCAHSVVLNYEVGNTCQ